MLWLLKQGASALHDGFNKSSALFLKSSTIQNSKHRFKKRGKEREREEGRRGRGHGERPTDRQTSHWPG